MSVPVKFIQGCCSLTSQGTKGSTGHLLKGWGPKDAHKPQNEYHWHKQEIVSTHTVHTLPKTGRYSI
jgi:hypothetical protein